MKVLIFVLLAAMTAEAQSVADLARKERERRAQAKTARVLTTADAKAGTATPPPATPVQAADSKKTTEGAKPPQSPAKSTTDPAQEWTAQTEKMRIAIRELQSQETALQLQVNEFTNQVYAPVTTLQARGQAQANLAATQSSLVTVRKELAEIRLKLEQMEAQGPPKNK